MAFLKRFIWGTIIVWIAISIASYLATDHEVSETYDGEMAQSARVLIVLYKSALISNSQPLSVTSPAFKRGELNSENYERKLYFQIWSDKGKLLMRSDNAPSEPLAQQINSFASKRLRNKEVRTLALKEPGGKFIVHVGQNLEVREENITDILKFLLYILFLALPLSLWLINKGLKSSTRPLNDLSDKIASRAEHDLSPFATNHVPTEMLGIVGALNKLMAKVDGALDRERQFISDAAHELRTPLAGIKAHAQVALKNEKHQRDALNNIIQGVDRTSTLANQLLTLSSADDLKALRDIDEVNLETLFEVVIKDLQAKLDEKSIRVETYAKTAEPLNGDKELLYILLRNLLDNAIAYSPERSVVRIETSSNAKILLLNIIDQGPGIKADQRERVFDRFYRDINTQTQGSGLGLAIAQKIARLHNADIQLATPESGTGLSVKVIFKLDPQALSRQD